MQVLIALDDRSVSLRAAREAVRLFPDASFLVVNVTQQRVPWVAATPFGTVYSSVPEDFGFEGLAEDELLSRAQSAGIEDAEAISMEGDPATVICEAAEAHDVDVVVVGSHDKGAWRRMIDGSVAQDVVQGTHRPVLVVSGEPPTP